MDQKKIEIIYEINQTGEGVKNKMVIGKKFSKREAQVENYMEKHPGISYREAVLKSGIGSESEEGFSAGDLDPDEVVRVAKLFDDAISSVNLTKDLDFLSVATQKKLNQAYQIVVNAKEELEELAKKQP